MTKRRFLRPPTSHYSLKQLLDISLKSYTFLQSPVAFHNSLQPPAVSYNLLIMFAVSNILVKAATPTRMQPMFSISLSTLVYKVTLTPCPVLRYGSGPGRPTATSYQHRGPGPSSTRRAWSPPGNAGREAMRQQPPHVCSWYLNEQFPIGSIQMDSRHL